MPFCYKKIVISAKNSLSLTPDYTTLEPDTESIKAQVTLLKLLFLSFYVEFLMKIEFLRLFLLILGSIVILRGKVRTASICGI